MPAAVDICNEALGYLGDEATIVSIDPPEGSAQADHCARFYPIALREILAVHPWNFALRRVELALTTEERAGDETASVFALPSDCLTVVSVQTGPAHTPISRGFYSIERSGGYTVLVTHSDVCWIAYVTSSPDPSTFPPAFGTALAHLLASKLAGPIIAGTSGQSTAQNEIRLYEYYLAIAKQTSSRQSKLAKPLMSFEFMGDYRDGGFYGLYR